MSVRRAASLAGISEGWWRHVEGGGFSRHGHWESLSASAQTLAAMARTVGVSADELTAAGRPDAAGELSAWRPSVSDPLLELRDLMRRVEELADHIEREGREDADGGRQAAAG